MDYEYYGLNEEENGLMCRLMRMTEFLMFPMMVGSQLFCFFLSALATIALARKYSKNSNSSLTFVLLLASACTLFVAIEVSVSGYLLVKINYNDMHRWVALLLIIGVCQLCELETICVFLVLAIQRFLSWQKPIMFMNQSKMTLIGQFVGIIVLCHILVLVPIVPIIANVPEHEWHHIYMRTETITQTISVILSAASIALQLYVSCHRQSTGEAMGDILSANPPQVQFTSLAQAEQQQQTSASSDGLDIFEGSNKESGGTQKISIVTMDEHTEAMQDQNGRDTSSLPIGGGRGVNDGESVVIGRQQSAIPRLMLIITIMTCLLCSLMVLDIFLWADLYYRENFSCWHYLLSQISFVGFFFKFWMLPAALLFGCRSLRQEVNLCTCMGSLFNKVKGIGGLFTSANSTNGKHEAFSNSEE